MRRFHDNKGLSLVEVVIALGLLGIFLSVAIKAYLNNKAASTHLRWDADLVEVGRILRGKIDCKKSFEQGQDYYNLSLHGCDSAGSQVELFDHDGNLLVGRKFTTILGWDIVAMCDKEGFWVGAARLKAGSRKTQSAWTARKNAHATDFHFVHDPLTNVVLNWDNALWNSEKGRRSVIPHGEMCAWRWRNNGEESAPRDGDTKTPNYQIARGDMFFKNPNWTTPGCMPPFGYPDTGNYLGLAKQDVWGKYIEGVATCPAGWRAVGGGAKCGQSYNTVWALSDRSTPGRKGGAYYVGGRVQMDGRSFYAKCCEFIRYDWATTVETLDTRPAKFARDAVWASCIPE
jgi:prepilin-type N-terminal cleavage/methylation domain-containing protein